MWGGYFILQTTRENRIITAKCLWSMLKHTDEPGMLWFFSNNKNCPGPEMIGGCVKPLRMFQMPYAQNVKLPWWFWVLYAMKVMWCQHISSFKFIESTSLRTLMCVTHSCKTKDYCCSMWQDVCIPTRLRSITYGPHLEEWLPNYFPNHLIPSMCLPTFPHVNLLDY